MYRVEKTHPITFSLEPDADSARNIQRLSKFENCFNFFYAEDMGPSTANILVSVTGVALTLSHPHTFTQQLLSFFIIYPLPLNCAGIRDFVVGEKTARLPAISFSTRITVIYTFK